MSVRAPPLQPALRAGLETEDLRCGPAKDANLNHPHAKYFFQDERIGTPPLAQTAKLTIGMDPFKEIEHWVASGARNSKPGLIWLRSPYIVEPVQLSADGKMMTWSKGSCYFQVVPRIATNRSYYDDSSIKYLANRPLRVRGVYDEKTHTFICESIWPLEWSLPTGALHETEHISPVAYPVILGASEAHRLRMYVRSKTLGVQSHERVELCFYQQILWAKELEKKPRSNPDMRDDDVSSSPKSSTMNDLCHYAGRPVVAILLNGAQSDDDEAQGGHLAVATGRIGPRGQCADWLVNNLYPLNFYSEKGILSSPLPLDAYMTDLNAGQSWYRPSYMIVAVLSDEEPAQLVQGGFARLFAQQYRARLEYNHATMNCSGIMVSVLRALGWQVPARGATSWLKAFLAVPVVGLSKFSLQAGCKDSDYLSEDATRLFPAAAFEELGADLLRMAAEGTNTTGGALRKQISSSLEAILFMRLPQIPSSRKLGLHPMVSIAEHFERWPADPAKRQIIPCPDRPPLPPSMRDPDSYATRTWRRSYSITVLWAAILGVLIGYLLSVMLRVDLYLTVLCSISTLVSITIFVLLRSK